MLNVEFRILNVERKKNETWERGNAEYRPLRAAAKLQARTTHRTWSASVRTSILHRADGVKPNAPQL